MLRSTFDEVLLRIAFSFMTCDSHIDRKELICVLEMAQDKYLFDCIEIEHELEKMLDIINLRGTDYLKDYFRKVDRSILTVSTTNSGYTSGC